MEWFPLDMDHATIRLKSAESRRRQRNGTALAEAFTALDTSAWEREDYIYCDLVTSPRFPIGNSYVQIQYMEGGDGNDDSRDVLVGSLSDPEAEAVTVGVICNGYSGGSHFSYFCFTEEMAGLPRDEQDRLMTDITAALRSEFYSPTI